MAAVGRLLISLRSVIIRPYFQDCLKPVSAFSLFLKSNTGCPIRCLATSNQAVAKVKMHSRTPYIIFAGDKMKDLRNANPGIRVPDIGRMLGQMWRILPEEEKETYRERYRKEKATFEEKKRAQIENLSEEEKEEMREEAEQRRQRRSIRRKKKLLKDLHKPKPGDVNPYVLFVKAKALERGDAPFQQYVRGLSEYWKKMPEEDKQPYIDEAKANSAKYRLKLAEWERRMIIEGHENLVRRSALKRPTRSRKAAGPKKPRKAAPRKQVAKAKVNTVGTQTETKAKAMGTTGKAMGTTATQTSGTQAAKRSTGKKSAANKSEE